MAALGYDLQNPRILQRFPHKSTWKNANICCFLIFETENIVGFFKNFYLVCQRGRLWEVELAAIVFIIHYYE